MRRRESRSAKRTADKGAPTGSRASKREPSIEDLQHAAGNRAVANALTAQASAPTNGRVITAPGCVLAWSGRHLQVSGDLEVSGPRSDAATAAAIASSIRGHWTGHWGDRSVSVTISVEHRPDERAADTRRSQIYVAEEDHDTDARTPIESGDVSLLPLNLAVGHDDLSRTPAEQFGTLLGHRSHESSPAWRGNLMGPRRGVRGVRVDEENVDDLLEANIGGGDD